MVRANRTVSSCTAGAAVVAAALAALAAPQAYGTDEDREQRSAAVLRELVPSSDGPGCAAAVGERGKVRR
ncbi:hypothetical protein ACIPW5_10300 [Streptomyces sp. NPDC090077]|uniref:hypothetical protein n=1 Tax=Streptomyces sp. NPDC090077 TaxID=3365938 RepID=UPI003822A041